MASTSDRNLATWLSNELRKKIERERPPEPPVSAGRMNELDRVRQFVSPLGGQARDVEKR